MDQLETTNAVLTVIALASVVQTLVIVAAAYGAYRAYRTVGRLVDAKLAPSLQRLEGVLTNLERTSAVVRTRADDMNRALDAVGTTAGRIGATIWPRAAVAIGMAGGVLGMVRQWRRRARGPQRAARAGDPARRDVTVVAG